MLPYEDPFSLSLLFHWNSEPWGNVAAYNDPHARMEFKSVGDAKRRVPLPKPVASPLLELIASRQSCREFSAEPIALGELASVLEAGYGLTGLRRWPNGHRTFRRAVPSAGGLYPLEVYVVCNRVESLLPGIYHFNVRAHALEPMQDCFTMAELPPDLMHQSFLEPASALCVLTAVLPRTLRKYGARGYRYVLIEAGHVAQNICLSAVELGLSALCVGGFTDHRLNRRLAADGSSEAALYAVAVGHSSSAKSSGSLRNTSML
jgi:SagB-type dehydrogenase family enzyme